MLKCIRDRHNRQRWEGREGQIETDRRTDRLTDRHTDRWTAREREREKGRREGVGDCSRNIQNLFAFHHQQYKINCNST